MQTWLTLTPGCSYLLGPKVWLPGAAGEGTGSAHPAFCGLLKAAEERQKLPMGCRGLGLVPKGCLGEPRAGLGVMLWHWGWLCFHSSPTPGPLPAASRSCPAPQGTLNVSSDCDTKSKTLNKRLHGPNILLPCLLETAWSEKSGLQTSTVGGSPAASSS